MKELVVMLASVMSFDDIIDRMEDEIKQYKITGSKEDRKKLIMSCILLSTKETVNENGSGFDGVEKTIKDLDSIDQARKFFSKSES